MWSEAFEILTLRSGHNTRVVLVGTALLGVAAGVVGVFALLRKRSLTADALSHAMLPGLAGAFLAASALGLGRSLPVLLLGAAVSGVLGILTIQWLLRHTRLREDAATGIVLSVFFGAGVVLLSVVQTRAPAGAAGLGHFLYGQTAALSVGDAWLMGGIAAAAVLSSVLLLKEFRLVCFNDAFARVDGWPVQAIDLLMMALVVLVTVAGIQAVGIILVVALLIIPAVAARFWTQRLGWLLLIAAVIGGGCAYLGAATSALLPRKPAGSVIVLVGGAAFGISLLAAPQRGLIAAGVRRLRLSLAVASDHVVEAAYRAAESPAPVVMDRAVGRGLYARLVRGLLPLRLRRRGYGRFVKPTSPQTPGVWRFEATEVGLDRGRAVDRNHRLWERYLIKYADVAPSHIDWAVDQVEHVLGADLVAELEAAVGVPAPEAGSDRPTPVAPVGTPR